MGENVTIECPACRRRIEVSAAYVAEYAGLEMDCPCGGAVRVPFVEAAAGGSAAAGLAAADAVSMTPAAAGPVRGVWRDSRRVVVARGTRMPDRCQLCNAPLAAPAAARTLRWVPPEHRRGAPHLARGVAVRFVASAMDDDHSRSIVVRVGRCPRHRFRLQPKVAAAVLAAVPVAALCSASYLDTDRVRGVAAYVAVGGLLVVAALALWPARVRIVAYRGTLAWVRGYGRLYVDALPPLTGE